MNIPSDVGGVAVIANEPAPSNLPPRNGKQLYYKKIKALLLEDGRTVYVCGACGEYTADATFRVVAHMSKHGRGNGNGNKNVKGIEGIKRKAAAGPTPMDVPSHLTYSLGEVAATLLDEGGAESLPSAAEFIPTSEESSNGHGPSVARDAVDAATAALDAVGALIGDRSAVIGERDHWRTRAEKAESELADLRAAIRDFTPSPEPGLSIKPEVVEHAKSRLQLLGKLTRSELRAMTGLSTTQLAELTDHLVDEGCAEVVRAPKGSGPASIVLRWIKE